MLFLLAIVSVGLIVGGAILAITSNHRMVVVAGLVLTWLGVVLFVRVTKSLVGA